LSLAILTKQVYSAEGGKVTLQPIVPDQLKPLTSILWKQNRNMVVEWIKNLDSTDYYGMFAGHTNLNIETGRLEINTWARNYSGVYSVEFNGQLQSKLYKVDVIKKVPKPTVVLKPLTCPNEDICRPICDGDTAGAEPVTYSWRTDQMDFYEESGNSTIISKDDSDVQYFFCQMKNPVSQEDSDPMKNPFHSGRLLLLVQQRCSHLSFYNSKFLGKTGNRGGVCVCVCVCVCVLVLTVCACASFQMRYKKRSLTEIAVLKVSFSHKSIEIKTC
uniref:Ig-like domain-containing protein n=1 Tax=Myripristis murdjan TaxID=586833 RepID=A0A667WQM9_9TELE